MANIMVIACAVIGHSKVYKYSSPVRGTWPSFIVVQDIFCASCNSKIGFQTLRGAEVDRLYIEGREDKWCQ